MAIGFHFDDIEEIYYGVNQRELPPIGAPIHDNEDIEKEDLPPMGAPYHD